MTQYITFLDEPEETHSPESLSATTSVIRDESFTTPPWVEAQETVWTACPVSVYSQEVCVPDRDHVEWMGIDREFYDPMTPEMEIVQVDDHIMQCLRKDREIYTRQVHVEHDPITEEMKMRFTVCGFHGDLYVPQLQEYVRHYREQFQQNPLIAV